MKIKHGGTFQKRFVTREQAERYRDRYRTGRHVHVDQIERQALHAILADLGRPAIAMDLPCGSGRLSGVLGEHFGHTILADGSTTMLEMAREDLPEQAMSFLAADIERTPLADRSVDLVFCHRFLHHIHAAGARAGILKELARVSRGHVLIPYYPSGIRTRVRWLIRRLRGKASSDTRPASMPRFIAEAEAAGLRLVRQHTLRKFPLKAAFCLFERV